MTRYTGIGGATLAAATIFGGCSAAPADGGETLGGSALALVSASAACPPVTTGGKCFALVQTTSQGGPKVNGVPAGYGPAELRSAYKLPSATGGVGQTIAIVDAFDDPNAEQDMNVYRAQFGIAPCTTANGCFRKINQDGAPGPYPANDHGWAVEISLDLDMASAVCPNCNIVLVEAKNHNWANLLSAVNTAVNAGANVVSLSWGGAEYATETEDEVTFLRHPGVAVVASSGDSGYGPEFPASSQYVTAVGGTTLTADGSPRGWSESVWPGAGSGCSRYVPKPAWQKDTACSNRTVVDVSAVADPATGVAIYDSFGYANASGWFVVGGTSVSAPLTASVYALAGNASSVAYGSYPYAHTNALFDVTNGSNGSCGGSYLCTGAPGYDGPTGLGTPNGTGAY